METRKAVAQLLADLLDLLHHPGDEVASSGKATDVFERRVRDALIGLKLALPQSFSQISDLMSEITGDLNPARRKSPDHPGPVRFRAVQLTDGEPVSLDVANDSRLDDLRGRIDHAADHAVDVNAGGNLPSGIDRFDVRAPVRALVSQKIPPRNAVLHGDDERLRADQAANLPGNRRELMGLHRQHDDVGHAGLVNPAGRGDRPGQTLGSVLLNEPDAGLPEGVEVRAPADERDLLSRQHEPCAEHATNGPGTDDTDPS